MTAETTTPVAPPEGVASAETFLAWGRVHYPELVVRAEAIVDAQGSPETPPAVATGGADNTNPAR